MNLYLVHCGFYDADTCDGLYESHVNYFIAAESFDEAKSKAKLLPEFKSKKMHIDGLQEVQIVNGCKVNLEFDPNLKDLTKILNYKHRELAPKSENS